MTFVSCHPASGRQTGVFEALSASQLEGRLQQSAEAAEGWRQRTFAERAALLNQLASQLSANRERLALIVTRELGQRLSESLAEVDRCAHECAYFAAHGQAMLPLARSLTTFEPMGTVLQLGTGRFPLWQAFRLLAPTLMAGNAVLLKPAENLPHCAREIDALVRSAGAPAGLVSCLLIDQPRVAGVIRDPRVAALAYGGNREDGARLAVLAGRQLKPVVLELDGPELQIILDDADPEAAVAAVLGAGLRNTGQLGRGARGVVVTPAIADDVVAMLAQRLAGMACGDPEDPRTGLGPLASAPVRERLHRQLQAARRQGARAVLGCELPAGPGWYYPASLLDGVTPEMPVFRRPAGGPLVSVLRVAGADDIPALCRGLDPGGSAGIWTRDLARGEQLGRQLAMDACFVNAVPGRDAGYPFAVGPSPAGRFNIKAFCTMKSLVLAV